MVLFILHSRIFIQHVIFKLVFVMTKLYFIGSSMIVYPCDELYVLLYIVETTFHNVTLYRTNK